MAGIPNRRLNSLSNRKNKGGADYHDDGVGDSSNNFDHETDVLLMYAEEAKQAAKSLAKYKKKIHKKMKQTECNNLERCKDKYNVNLRNLHESANKIVKVLPKIEPHPEKGIKRLKSDIASRTSRTKEYNECSRNQTDIRRRTDDLSRKTDVVDRLQRELNESNKEKTDEVNRLQRELNESKEAKTDEVNRFQSGQEEKTAVVNRLQWKLNELQNEKTDAVNHLQWKLNELQKEKTDEVNRLQRELNESKKAKTDEVNHLQWKLNELQKERTDEVNRIQRELNESKKAKTDEVNHLQWKLNELQKEAMDEVNRLERQLKESKEVFSARDSSKLRDNNPNSTDLSDVNRPTKIGEKMSELYDSEWTDAYEELEKYFSEGVVIQKLLDLIKAVYDGCTSISTDHFFETIQAYIEQSETSAHAIARKDAKLPDTLKQQIKEFRKFKAIETLPHIQKLLCNRTTLLTEPMLQTKHVQIYIKKCIELCWLMAVQDPPLFLSTDVPASFDTNRFKDYTKRGPYIEFLVWPTLYLHEGGAILMKGVAQGCKSVPPARQSSFERGHPN